MNKLIVTKDINIDLKKLKKLQRRYNFGIQQIKDSENYTKKIEIDHNAVFVLDQSELDGTDYLGNDQTKSNFAEIISVIWEHSDTRKLVSHIDSGADIFLTNDHHFDKIKLLNKISTLKIMNLEEFEIYLQDKRNAK